MLIITKTDKSKRYFNVDSQLTFSNEKLVISYSNNVESFPVEDIKEILSVETKPRCRK